MTIARAGGSVRLPAEVQLVGAMNPCRRGCRSVEGCVCTPAERARYLGRLSAPLLDRIDLHVDVGPVAPRRGAAGARAASSESAAVRQRVGTGARAPARAVRARRGRVNARLDAAPACEPLPAGAGGAGAAHAGGGAAWLLGAGPRPRAQGRADDRRPGERGGDRGRAPGRGARLPHARSRDPLSARALDASAERRLPRGRGSSRWMARLTPCAARPMRAGRAARGSRNASSRPAAPGRTSRSRDPSPATAPTGSSGPPLRASITTRSRRRAPVPRTLSVVPR